VAKSDLDAAISSLRRALDEPLRPEVRRELLLELGRFEARTFLPDSAGHLRSAYELALEPSARGHAALHLARTLLFLGDPNEAAALASRAALELPAES
jgi:hypothetical protein